MKKITLLTSLDIDNYIHDDHVLISELEARGFDIQSKPWETLQDEGEDLFIIRTTWNYTEHIDKFIKCLNTIQDRLWNPLPLVQWNANKKYLLELQSKDVGVMPLRLAKDQTSLEQAIDQLGGDDFVAKPLVSASAKGLIRFGRSQLPNMQEEMIIQKFYKEIHQGENSLIYFNGQYAYAIKKTPKEGEIRVQEEYGGQITPYAPTSDELKLADKVLANLPEPSLYARVDIIPGIGLIELECIEPSLFFSRSQHGAKLFADAISHRLS